MRSATVWIKSFTGSVVFTSVLHRNRQDNKPHLTFTKAKEMRCNVISLLIGCVVIAVTALPERKDELEKPLIDFLTLDYLSVAQTIWLTIETHADRQSTLARINDEHQRFFGSDFGETASLRHAYYVPLDAGNSHEYQYYSQFINNLQRLDSNFATASNVAQSLATQNESAIGMAIDRFERDIYVHSVQLSDSIFEEVSAARFWNKGKSVKWEQQFGCSKYHTVDNWFSNLRFQYIEFCTNGTTVVPIESEFQLVYNYYKDVRSALLKGYILTQFSLMLLAVKNLGQCRRVCSVLLMLYLYIRIFCYDLLWMW